MAVDLLNRVKVFWNSEAIQQLSVMLDEQPDRVTQALSLGASTFLAGLLRSASGATGADHLVDQMKDEPEEMARFGGLSGLLKHLAGLGDVVGLDPLVQHGRSVLRSIFGDKLDDVINLIANDSGAKPSTAGALMSLLAPTLMGLIRKEIGAQGLTGESLRGFLANQRDSVFAQVPGNLAETLGARSLADFVASPEPARAPVTGQTPAGAVKAAPLDPAKPVVHESAPVAKEPSSTWWAIPLAIAIVAVVAGYFLLPQANPPDAGPEVATQPQPEMNRPAVAPSGDEEAKPEIDGVARADVTSPAVTADGRPVVATGEQRISMALPGDASVEVPQGSYLEAAVKMLRDDKAKAAQTFNADDLAFNQDSSLTTESAQSADRLAIIAKAYPKAKIKVEVRESPGGPDDVDQRRATAQKRADAVRDALTQAGVSADRVTAGVNAADALDAPESTKKTADVKIEITPE
jgi:outer membrane protein OmpA-like peptidoglycan-associated protein